MNLTAHVMQVIDKHLPINDERDVRRSIARELEELFYAAGVDVITEADRIAAGCMPRDHNGLTLEEIRAIDAVYLKQILEPFTTMIIPNEDNFKFK